MTRIIVFCLGLISLSAWAVAPCDGLMAGAGVSRRSVILGLGLLPVLSLKASGEGIYRSVSSESAAFLDQSDPDQVVVLESNRVSRLRRYSQDQFSIAVVDSRCSISALRDSIYAKGYFVGLNSLCRINGDRLDFVAQLKPPSGAFSMTYAGEDGRFIYILVNGRPFPSGQEGYLRLRAIDRRSQAVTELVVAEHVPNFSGGLWTEGDTIYVVAAAAGSAGRDPSNEIFSLQASDLRDAFQSGKPKDFLSLAKKVAGPFPGLSLSLVGGADGFLIDNNEFGKYLINGRTQQKANVAIPSECQVIGPWQGQWLALCGSSLKLL